MEIPVIADKDQKWVALSACRLLGRFDCKMDAIDAVNAEEKRCLEAERDA